MGGQMQQSNAAALYEHSGSLQNAGNSSDAGDAVMARWLQSTGLQHLASPVASTGIDHRLLPNLLMQHAVSEPFETSPFVPLVERGFENDYEQTIGTRKSQMEAALKLSMVEKETSGKETNLAKIKVVVRKRPLNKKELARKEEDIVTISDQACLTVHEPKLKVCSWDGCLACI